MNLVVQGPALSDGDVEALALLVKPGFVEPVAPRAFRLRRAMKNEGVAALCEARRIDHAWMPEGRRFADLRLVAMDMDSTLINIECIDELGDLAGRKAEIAAVTAQAMRGEIEYRESLRRRVRALAGLPEDSLLRVYEQRLKLTPGAEALVGACKKHGVKLLLVSGGFTFFTERLRERLGLDFAFANTLATEHGRLTGRVVEPVFDAAAKVAALREAAASTGREGLVVAIGDGANDLPMLRAADVSVAYHAKPVVRAAATHAIDHCGLDAVLNLFA
jgi:phosphoserine phosphatase